MRKRESESWKFVVVRRKYLIESPHSSKAKGRLWRTEKQLENLFVINIILINTHTECQKKKSNLWLLTVPEMAGVSSFEVTLRMSHIPRAASKMTISLLCLRQLSR